ncbi:hypothetical protein M2317_001312 [Microbacterium sp. ZKA21]|uniref:hypothetical protein n=1 Tax=Microbacterium sp. ZKA21 TaxID=3381694 RepID=UPI003D1BF372
MPNRRTTIIAAAVSVAVLAGLVALAVPAFVSVDDDLTPAATTSTPMPAPTSTEAPAAQSIVEAEPATEPTPSETYREECGGPIALVPVDDSDPDRVVGYRNDMIRDTGPRTGATGDVSLNDAGTPVAYRVAEGDTLWAIGERLCTQRIWIEMVNSVRRNGASALYPGDTLNLDMYAITSVGDENGVVYDNDPGFYIPPQQ